jgi:UDP-N-acetylglucosamine acyltransferase
MSRHLLERIHPTALVHPDANLGEGASVGPYACIESGVSIGEDCEIGAFCTLRTGTKLGNRVRLDMGCVLGGEPQDMKFRGEATSVHIGDDSRLREYVTVNRGTAARGVTMVGKQCLLMAYCHVAHDCLIEDGVIVANGVQMGGHVTLGTGCVVSGMTGIHQFVTIGAGAFVGGGLRVDKDIPPGIKALGDPLRWGGINGIGWQRLGFGIAETQAIEQFYRQFKSEQSMSGKDFKFEAGAWQELFGHVNETAAERMRGYFRDFASRSRRSWVLRGLRS